MLVPIIDTIRLFITGRSADSAIGLKFMSRVNTVLKLFNVGLFGIQNIFPVAAVHSGNGLNAIVAIQYIGNRNSTVTIITSTNFKTLA